MPFIQINSDQSIFMDGTMCTCYYCLKEAGNFTMGRKFYHGSALVSAKHWKHHKSIRQFCKCVYRVPSLPTTHYPRISTTTHTRGAERLAPDYCNGPLYDYATCLLGLHERNAGLNSILIACEL